jgi:hypothetical protein
MFQSMLGRRAEAEQYFEFPASSGRPFLRFNAPTRHHCRGLAHQAKEQGMAGSNVIDFLKPRESRRPARKWSFPQGFMIGIVPVMVWTPVWFVPVSAGRPE